MDKQQQFPSLLASLNNLPLHVLLSVLEYLDQETRLMIEDNVPHNERDNQIFLKFISFSLFSQKYLRCTDRSVYLSFYSEPAFLAYERNLQADICVRDPNKYFRIQAAIQQLLATMDSQLQCLESRQSLLEIIENQIRDPEIPFPRMRREGIAMHCNSSLQHALVDLFFEGKAGQDEEFVEDCVLDLEQFLQCLLDNIDTVLQQTNKQPNKPPLQILKQCYYHPQLLTLQNYHNYLIPSLTAHNLFILLHTLLSGISQMYHEYILDQGKEFQRFVEFLMRYGIYRSMVLSFQGMGLSRVLYRAVQRVLERAVAGDGERVQDMVIPEVPIKLESKPSQEYEMQVEQLGLAQKISRISSQAKTQKSTEPYKPHLQMSSRLFLASGKIWSNQCRRVKQLNEETISPSRYLSLISQETINNRNYIKVLNRLVHFRMLDALAEEIQGACQLNVVRESSPPPLRDQDIVNIFGNNYEGYELDSPTYSQHSAQNAASLSPTSPYSNFNDMMRSFTDLSCNSTYSTILMALENRMRSQPYRYEKGTEQHFNNDTCSNSPDKQKNQMPQIHFQSCHKLPSLESKKLLSKTSMISKFTKISQSKAMGSVQDLFQSQLGIQEQILMQYHSYLIDLSVNQLTVHWTGHTEQQLMGQLYGHFEEYFVRYCEGFMCYLVKCVGEIAGKIEQETAKMKKKFGREEGVGVRVLRKCLEKFVEYLDTGFVGKRTLNKLVRTANQITEIFSNKHKSQSQKQPKPQPQIDLHLPEINKMIEHYNLQMWQIAKNVPEQKLKIYERKKSIRNVIQVLRCQNENKDGQGQGMGQGVGKKLERKRRNSEQVLIAHNMGNQ